ncbi:hypothetical protein BLNAU_8090 [Blattamonas nauphoetae]|uniref:Uncharacterized protein n=1 Tax=Blattamonas nauphoetae TaxID=2049346 RepID=A0ABQ9XZW2_9EUKA|nr:hypothetical protein BLNAU_8090 [Blattamonas nauphoetae]
MRSPKKETSTTQLVGAPMSSVVDVVGCGEFWDRVAFGEHSELDVIAADAADNQHGAGGGWAGGFDGSGEQAGSTSEEIVKTFLAFL